MAKIFCAHAVNKFDPDSEIKAFLDLPATPYEMSDVMDKLRNRAGVKFVADCYYRFASLENFLYEPNDLYELNALAQKLSELDDQQETAFEGLLMIESGTRKSSLALPDLIDLAYSTDRCHVIGDALNDSQLGRFCAESGLVPGAEDLPDSLFELLDFERIGREHRRQTGGVLVKRTADHPGGYVEQYSNSVKMYRTLDLIPKKPDYALCLRVARGYYAPAASDCKKSVQLKLPASPEMLEKVLSDLKVNRWQETVWYGLDCRAPMLSDMIYDIGVNDAFTEVWMEQLNSLAQRLADMDSKKLTAYKALLSAVDCGSIQSAAQLMDMLHNYTFSPEYSSPIEVAKGELSDILCDAEQGQIMSCLDLRRYGEALIRDCGGVLTDYGLIEREDRQPVQEWDTRQDSQTQRGE